MTSARFSNIYMLICLMSVICSLHAQYLTFGTQSSESQSGKPFLMSSAPPFQATRNRRSADLVVGAEAPNTSKIKNDIDAAHQPTITTVSVYPYTNILKGLEHDMKS